MYRLPERALRVACPDLETGEMIGYSGLEKGIGVDV